VMVTGATGFVGGHTAAALLAAGHDVTALVRSRGRLDDAMSTLEGGVPDVVVGDMTDADSVAAALDGADAVVHCAAVVSLDRRNDALMSSMNPIGLRNVVGQAAQRGLDPIVYTSSTSALFEVGAGVLTERSEVTSTRHPYGRSKGLCERIAREYQTDGAPVVITYPSGILGPAAGSALGETSVSMAGFVAAGVMPTRGAALSFIDVRDLANAYVAVMEAGHGPRRVMCGGTLVTMEELAVLLREITGRRFGIAPVPPSMLRGVGRMLDALGSVVPFQTPMTEEAMTLVTQWVGTNDRTFRELGVHRRDGRETLTDSMRAWKNAGLIKEHHLGRLDDSAERAKSATFAGRMASVEVPGRVLASRPFRAIAPRVLPAGHRFVLRLSRGRTLLDSEAQPMLMLRSTGAKSGQQRESPMATVPLDDGRFLVVGSNFAREPHPSWTYNLLAHPEATIVFRGATINVTSRLLVGEERAERWPELLEWYPGWADYTQITDREFRIFELVPRADRDSSAPSR